MSTTDQSPPPSKAMLWTGRIISIVPCLLLIMSAVMKLTRSAAAIKGFGELGWPVSMALPLGILELSCVVLYLIPQTAVLGAILLTGYMGGAIATHLRLEQAPFMQALVPIVAWLGLFLRDNRLRPLLPLRTLK